MVLTQLRCIKQSVVAAFYLAPGCFYGEDDDVGGGGGAAGWWWVVGGPAGVGAGVALQKHKEDSKERIFKLCVTKIAIKDTKGDSPLWKQVQDELVTIIAIVTDTEIDYYSKCYCELTGITSLQLLWT